MHRAGIELTNFSLVNRVFSNYSLASFFWIGTPFCNWVGFYFFHLTQLKPDFLSRKKMRFLKGTYKNPWGPILNRKWISHFFFWTETCIGFDSLWIFIPWPFENTLQEEVIVNSVLILSATFLPSLEFYFHFRYLYDMFQDLPSLLVLLQETSFPQMQNDSRT